MVLGPSAETGWGDFWNLTDWVEPKPQSGNCVLLILIRKTLNKIYLEAVYQAIPSSERWAFPSCHPISLTPSQVPVGVAETGSMFPVINKNWNFRVSCRSLSVPVITALSSGMGIQ